MTIVSILYFSLCRYPGAGLSLSLPAGCIGCIRKNDHLPNEMLPRSLRI
jgi:hypothetical protein